MAGFSLSLLLSDTSVLLASLLAHHVVMVVVDPSA
jgi:hypothetical protein